MMVYTSGRFKNSKMKDCFVDIDVTPISDVTGSLLDYHGGGQPLFQDSSTSPVSPLLKDLEMLGIRQLRPALVTKSDTKMWSSIRRG